MVTPLNVVVPLPVRLPATTVLVMLLVLPAPEKVRLPVATVPVMLFVPAPEKMTVPDPVIALPVSVAFWVLFVPSRVWLPAFEKVSVAPDAVLNVPVCVVAALLRVSVPTLLFTVPLLVNSTLLLPPVGVP